MPVVTRVECRREVDRAEWDRELTVLGGSFFHCYDYVMLESSRRIQPRCS